MIRVIGAITLHIWDDVGLAVVDHGQEEELTWPLSGGDFSTFVDASWAAALTWLWARGLEVVGEDPVASSEQYDVYALYAPESA